MRLLSIIGILGVSAFKSVPSHGVPDCTICYGDQDCLTLEQARCEYYLATDQVLKGHEEENYEEEDDKPDLREAVDAMVFDLVQKASEMNTECIPYISEYSDCTKENICVGCKSCLCDALGAWNCSIVQRCRVDGGLSVDHRVLVSVMESLADSNTVRKKRSVSNQLNPQIQSFKNIQEWWHGSPIQKADGPLGEKLRQDNTLGGSNDTYTTSDPDDLAFDDVLRNIGVESKSNGRKKPLLDAEIIKIAIRNSTDNFMDLLRALETKEEGNTEAPTQGVTKVVVDLLESAKRYAQEHSNNSMSSYFNEYMDLDNKLNERKQYSDTNNFIDDQNINIMKREVHLENDTSQHTDAPSNITGAVAELKDSVLTPMSKIINEKELELNELKRIRGNLMKTIKSYDSGDIELNIHSNDTSEQSETRLSIYNLEVEPQLEIDGRRVNKKAFVNLIIKLKRDITEVIRSAARIQKMTPIENIPENLKYLIRALKYYIRNETKKSSMPYHKKASNVSRRYLSVKPNPKLLRDCIVEIIQQLDMDMPKSDALRHLSTPTKRILKRVIKKHYTDENSVIQMRVSDEKYNLTNDLLTIGHKWQKMTTDVVKSLPVNRLYAMKLLHFVLSADIGKMMDALKIIDFSRSRRMMAIYPPEGEQVIKNINSDIKDVYGKIQLLTPNLDQIKPAEEVFRRSNTEKKEKLPFFKRIKKLLKGSKNEIKMLLKKKVPKSEIVEEIAKKKMDELTRTKLTEYEDIMKKWQNDMGLLKRDKRNLNIKNRIRNIIPRYLRGKLNPAIAAKDAKIRKSHSKTKKDLATFSATTPALKLVTISKRLFTTMVK